MPRLTQSDLDRLLDETIYSWDTATMLSGLVDFLEFSEHNLSWQREREIRRARDEGATVELEPPNEHLVGQYRTQLIESAEYRFDVSLSQSVRYAGLVAFVTTAELCAKTFAKALNTRFRDAPDGENEHVHLLACMNGASSSDFGDDIADLRNLVRARNCVVHAAGFLQRYKFEAQVRDALESLRGFAIWDEDYLGVSIRIERGAVESYAKRAAEWVPILHKRSTECGILKA